MTLFRFFIGENLEILINCAIIIKLACNSLIFKIKNMFSRKLESISPEERKEIKEKIKKETDDMLAGLNEHGAIIDIKLAMSKQAIKDSRKRADIQRKIKEMENIGQPNENELEEAMGKAEVLVRKEERLNFIFQKYEELISLANRGDQALRRTILKDGQKSVPARLSVVVLEKIKKDFQFFLPFKQENFFLKKVKKFFSEAKLENSKEFSEQELDELIKQIKKKETEIELISALLTATKKAGAEQNVSGIKGVELEVVDGKKLAENEPLAEKLTVMYRANNSHKSEKDLERLLGDFEKHKQYEPKFNLIYFDRENKTNPKKSLENLVGFMRSSGCITKFEEQPLVELPEGERYLGAMNIDPILQKFYFGENFLREIMEKEFSSGTKKLIAHVPENGPSHKIVKLLGFETVAEEGDYRDDAGDIIAKRLRVELARD